MGEMKIQCSVCGAAEAAVLCCADEATLCQACDEKVHSANKLASMHQRVSLSKSSSQMPKCDICQDMVGYFFCVEDRALLCRKCDVSVHTLNPFVSAHQRFLLTGIKVGLEALDPSPSSSVVKLLPAEKVSEPETCSVPRRTVPKSLRVPFKKAAPKQSSTVGNLIPFKKSGTASFSGDLLPVQSGGITDNTAPTMSFSGGSVIGSLPQWHMDDFIGPSKFNQNFGLGDNDSSKADSGMLVESDSSSILRSSEDNLDFNERLGQVPDLAWSVLQAASLPTASGLLWPSNPHPGADNAVSVPDISWTSLGISRLHQPNPKMSRCRRHS